MPQSTSPARRTRPSPPQTSMSPMGLSPISSRRSSMSTKSSSGTNLLEELEKLTKEKMSKAAARQSLSSGMHTPPASNIRDDRSVKSDSSGLSSAPGNYGPQTATSCRPSIMDFKDELKRNEFPLGLRTAIEDSCIMLYKAVRRRAQEVDSETTPTGSPTEHQGFFGRLDEVYTTLMSVDFEVLGCKPKPKRRLPKFPMEEYARELCKLLGRLPNPPRELPQGSLELPGNLRETIPLELEDPYGQLEWGNLQIVLTPASREIRLAALKVLRSEIDIKPNMLLYINATAHLINEAFKRMKKLSGQNSDEGRNRDCWLVVIMFLWASWQRATMLHLHSLLDGNLRRGFNPKSQAQQLRLQPVDLWEYAEEDDLQSPEKSEDMCNWAWLVLRNDSALVTKDFRYFLQVYQEFAADGGRCVFDNSGIGHACNGLSPYFCRRSENLSTTYHVPGCSRECPRISWDRDSFYSVKGDADSEADDLDEELAYSVTTARAVHATPSVYAKSLCYGPITSNTVSFSHVTAHGREGSPEDGVPSCWHEKCTEITRGLRGDSYWIDNSCIPGTDKPTRKKIIDQINDIFSTSKAVVICDRDLMSINVPAGLDVKQVEKLDSKRIDRATEDDKIKILEQIVAKFIVSDWNLRAWPLLEGIRGKQNLHLLLSNNTTLPLASILKVVSRHARLDLAIVGLTVRHLLPWKQPRVLDLSHLAPRHVPAREATKLLSFRSARRYGDRRIIQTLLEGRVPSTFYGSQPYRRSNAFSWLQNASTLAEISDWLAVPPQGSSAQRQKPLLVVGALPEHITTSPEQRPGEEDIISWAPELPQTYLSLGDPQDFGDVRRLLHLRMDGKHECQFQNIAHVMVNWTAWQFHTSDIGSVLQGQNESVCLALKDLLKDFEKGAVLFPNGSFQYPDIQSVGICGFGRRPDTIDPKFLQKNFWTWLGALEWNTALDRRRRACNVHLVISLPHRDDHDRYELLAIPPRVSHAIRQNDFRKIFEDAPVRMQAFDTFRLLTRPNAGEPDEKLVSEMPMKYDSMKTFHSLKDDTIRTEVQGPEWIEFVEKEELKGQITDINKIEHFVEALKDLKVASENSTLMYDPKFKEILRVVNVLILVWQDPSVTAPSNLHRHEAFPHPTFHELTAEMKDNSPSIKNTYVRLLEVFDKYKDQYKKPMHDGRPDEALNTLLISILHLKGTSEHHRTQMQECLRYWFQWKKSVERDESASFHDIQSLFDSVSIILLSKLNRREKETRRLGEMIRGWIKQLHFNSFPEVLTDCNRVINVMVDLKVLPSEPRSHQVLLALLEQVVAADEDEVGQRLGSERQSFHRAILPTGPDISQQRRDNTMLFEFRHRSHPPF